MRGIVVVLAFAACDGPTPAQPNAAAPDAAPLVLAEIPMNIVVVPNAIDVWMEGADFGGTCSGQKFPTPGECGEYYDGNVCSNDWAMQSCITVIAVEVDGVRVSPIGFPMDPWRFSDPRFATGSLTLVIAGCGHAETRISLDGAAPPGVNATAIHDTAGAHVAWATDAPSSSAIVTIFGPGLLSARFCHVVGVNEQVFPYAGHATKAFVDAIGTRTDVVTGLGTATIWRGGFALAVFSN